MADFFARTEKLAKQVGDVNLEGTFAVDGGGRTIPLEVGYWQNHAGQNGYVRIENYTDGQPHAAQNSLEVTYEQSLRRIAENLLERGPQEGMVDAVEAIDEEFKKRAPRVTGSYRDSTARFVTDNGALIHQEYDSHYGQEPS